MTKGTGWFQRKRFGCGYAVLLSTDLTHESAEGVDGEDEGIEFL